VTVNVWPATVIMPVRKALPEFAATLSVTMPLPVPVAPPMIVIHGAALTAVQVHPAPAVTEKRLDDAPEPTETPVGDRL
jgi:hypothetical protein